jgi:hypothetical protein
MLAKEVTLLVAGFPSSAFEKRDRKNELRKLGRRRDDF